MAFVRNSGNPGLAAATEGAAAGFREARAIQDSQQAREMAMQELQMRQQRNDLAFDSFAEQLRRTQAEEARADLRLASDAGYREATQSLAERKFDLVTERAKQEDALNEKRAEAHNLLLRAMDGAGSVTPKAYRSLVESIRGFPPEIQTEILGRGRQIKGVQRSIDQQAAARDLEFSERYILNSGTSPETTAALNERLLNLRLTTTGNPEAYAAGVKAFQDELLEASTKREEIERWVDESSKRIEAGVGDVDERQEAYKLRRYVAEIGRDNPMDPRIEKFQKRMDWLATPQSVRREKEEATKALASANIALSAIGMDGIDHERMEELKSITDVQRGVNSELIGGAFAKTEEERGNRVMAGLKAAQMDINLDVLLPVDLAVDQQLEYIFQQIEQAEVAMGGVVEEEAITEHIRNLFERGGVVADTAARDKYVAWTGNRRILDTSGLNQSKILNANIYKKEERQAGRTQRALDERKAVEQWWETFELNKEARRNGVRQLPLGDPPAEIEEEARRKGWHRPGEKGEIQHLGKDIGRGIMKAVGGVGGAMDAVMDALPGSEARAWGALGGDIDLEDAKSEARSISESASSMAGDRRIDYGSGTPAASRLAEKQLGYDPYAIPRPRTEEELKDLGPDSRAKAKDRLDRQKAAGEQFVAKGLERAKRIDAAEKAAADAIEADKEAERERVKKRDAEWAKDRAKWNADTSNRQRRKEEAAEAKKAKKLEQARLEAKSLIAKEKRDRAAKEKRRLEANRAMTQKRVDEVQVRHYYRTQLAEIEHEREEIDKYEDAIDNYMRTMSEKERKESKSLRALREHVIVRRRELQHWWEEVDSVRPSAPNAMARMKERRKERDRKKKQGGE